MAISPIDIMDGMYRRKCVCRVNFYEKTTSEITIHTIHSLIANKQYSKRTILTRAPNMLNSE